MRNDGGRMEGDPAHVDRVQGDAVGGPVPACESSSSGCLAKGEPYPDESRRRDAEAAWVAWGPGDM